MYSVLTSSLYKRQCVRGTDLGSLSLGQQKLELAPGTLCIRRPGLKDRAHAAIPLPTAYNNV